jgi:hypothetical protein
LGGESVLISTIPAGLAGSGEGMRDAGGLSAADDEVPLIFNLDVDESRPGPRRGRVDACGGYMVDGNTSTKVEVGTFNAEGARGK